MDTNLIRKLTPTTHRQGIYIAEQGKKYINFSSNDYLGLGTNETIRKNFLEQILALQSPYTENLFAEALFSSSSSRLLSGNSAPYIRLESFLANWYAKEAALLFNSGYHANLGIIAGLMQKGDSIFSDKLNHNSIIAGIKQSNADFYRYKHRDYTHLEDLLKKHRHTYKKALIITESVFSMDGDCASLTDLIFLKEKYHCKLMLDEAHGIGVLGKKAQGLCNEKENYIPRIDIIMGALGKAMGSQGAYCVAEKEIIDTLINFAPTFIFSTALPPIQILWTEYLLTACMEHILKQRQKLKTLMQAFSLSSHIVPVIIGENDAAIRVAGQLREKGFFVLPVRPPTVPKHTARLRLSLCADMKQEHVAQLFSELEACQCSLNG
jgi:8-amino-7-oxononanoate synthase